jgi:hypothetical protein
VPDALTVAGVDAHGCATVLQRIRGSFDKPEAEKPSVLTSLTGPMGQLLKQASQSWAASRSAPWKPNTARVPRQSLM